MYCKTTFGITLSVEEAEKHRAAFFRNYAGLARWHRQTLNSRAKETRSTLGRRRLLHEFSRGTERLNSPVQGDEADGAKLAMALLWERRAECPGAVPVIFCHDEICVECDAGQAEQVKAWLVEAMYDGMADLLAPVPCQVDAKVVPTWGG